MAAAESPGEIDLPGSPSNSLGPGRLEALDGLRPAVFDPTVGESGGTSPAGHLVRVRVSSTTQL